MTASQILACAIGWTVAIVAITALVLTRRSREERVRYRVEYSDGHGMLTTQKPLTEAELKAFEAQWRRRYGRTNAACSAYQPPAAPVDSGLCARCGMYDYKHEEQPGA